MIIEQTLRALENDASVTSMLSSTAASKTHPLRTTPTSRSNSGMQKKKQPLGSPNTNTDSKATPPAPVPMPVRASEYTPLELAAYLGDMQALLR